MPPLSVDAIHLTLFAKGDRTQPVAWHAEARYAWRPVLTYCAAGLSEIRCVNHDEHSLHTDAVLLPLRRSSAPCPSQLVALQMVSTQARQGREARAACQPVAINLERPVVAHPSIINLAVFVARTVSWQQDHQGKLLAKTAHTALAKTARQA
jgi:hypothetical protein